CQRSRVGCSRRPWTVCHVSPESVERKSTAGVPPSQSSPGRLSWPGRRCQSFSSVSPLSSASPTCSERSHVLPPSVERCTVAPYTKLVEHAYSEPSRGSPIAGITSQPLRSGPSTSPRRLLSSLRRQKSPLRVPTRTPTSAMGRSLPLSVLPAHV